MGARSLTIVIALIGVTTGVSAQWVNHPTPGLPRTQDGKPNLTAPVPRTWDGKPDLSGVWQAEGASIPELRKLLPGGQNGLGEDIPTKYFINYFADYEHGKEPLQPTALAHASTLSVSKVSADNTSLNCLPSGLPIAVTAPAPFKLVQTPGLVVMLVEADTSFRQIFTDGRQHPTDPLPSWYGSSIGRWDGDTLVVDTVGLNDKTQLDAAGHRHSDAMTVIERFQRVDTGHMNVQLTLTDPKTFTAPVTVNFRAVLRPDTDLIEYFCSENEKDRERILAVQ